MLNFFQKQIYVGFASGYNLIKNSTFRLNYSKLTKMPTQDPPGIIETAIRETLTEHLKPTFLEVVNESSMHNVPRNAETHFKVLVVSELFEGASLIKRHRMINDLVQKRLGDDFPHALSIDTKTPSQYDGKPVERSAPCLGGFGK